LIYLVFILYIFYSSETLFPDYVTSDEIFFIAESILTIPLSLVMAILFYRIFRKMDSDDPSRRAFLAVYAAWLLLGIGSVLRGLFYDPILFMPSVIPFLIAQSLLAIAWIFMVYTMIVRKASVVTWEKKEQERRLRLHLCPQCKNRTQEDWAMCPYCGTKLQ
jgi:hypothetical protein